MGSEIFTFENQKIIGTEIPLPPPTFSVSCSVILSGLKFLYNHLANDCNSSQEVFSFENEIWLYILEIDSEGLFIDYTPREKNKKEKKYNREKCIFEGPS